MSGGGGTPTEQVAEAIWRAGYPRESANRTWADLVNKAHYRAMARAAIDALRLTEEWGWQLGNLQPHRYDSREQAQARVDELNEAYRAAPEGQKRYSPLPRRVVSRLVSPWVEGSTEC